MRDAIDQTGYPNNIFRYIERNMAEEIDTALLSAVGSISCAQLYRDFYSLTGHSVKEYVRKRRLSNALALVKASDMGFAHIAFQCGYSSHQALCRAARETLGLTLSDYRRGDTYYFFPPWSGRPPHPVRVSGETIPRARCVLYSHASPENIENLAVAALLRALPDYGGRIFGRNAEKSGDRFFYALFLTGANDLRALRPFGFERSCDAPGAAALFASTTVENDADKIGAAWDYLYAEWLQNSMFEYTGEPHFEEYILKNGRPAKLRLYLPIRRRNLETKISLIPNPGLRFLVARSEGQDAERVASEAVIGFLATHDPETLRASRAFYLRKEANACACGVLANGPFPIVGAEGIEILATDRADYLMLESGVMGDYDRYAETLSSFARENGLAADERCLFAVYDASESFENPRIRMYCPVHIEKK